MANPFAVVPNPGDPKSSSHLLFFLVGTKQQLGMEVRPLAQATGYFHYKDNGLPQGIITNPSAWAATVHNGAVTVYGRTTIASGSTTATYISTLSPFLDPISTDTGAVSTPPGLAACASEDESINWVYYLGMPDNVNYRIMEFSVDGSSTTPSQHFAAVPSQNTHLAAVTFNTTGDRFIIYSNTDGGTNSGKKGLYWVNSSDDSATYIDGTINVNPGSPLAVTSIAGGDSTGPFLNIMLYYTDGNNALIRICGTARNSTIEWLSNDYPSASAVDPSSLMTAATDGKTNYVYYLHTNQTGVCGVPFSETISSSWFP